jgi:cytochrome c oxidase subunit III
MSLFGRLTEKSWENPGADPTSDPALYRPSAAAVGLRVFFGIVTMLFGLVAMAYVMRMGTVAMEHGPVSDWRPMPDPPLLWINSAILILSGLAWEAARAGARIGRGLLLFAGVVAAGLLALLFLAGQLALWEQYAARGYYAAANPSYSFFYLITGLHGLHLLGGLYVWGRTVSRLLAGADAGAVRATVDLCAAYWHFLLVIWLVMLGLLIST